MFPKRPDNFVHLLCDFSQGKKKKGDEVADDEDDVDAVKTVCHKTEWQQHRDTVF